MRYDFLATDFRFFHASRTSNSRSLHSRPFERGNALPQDGSGRQGGFRATSDWKPDDPAQDTGFPFILGQSVSSLSNQKTMNEENSTRPAWKIEIIPAPASNADEILSGRKQPVPTAELRGKTVILRQPRREIHVSGVSLDRMCEALVILQDLKTRDYPDWVNPSDISIGTGRKASLALIAACTTVAFREL